MNRFEKQNFKKKIIEKLPISGLVFLAVMMFFLIGVAKIADSEVMNDQRIIEEAIQKDVVHCYAIEGQYPPSLAYMEDHYGLTYDKEKFIVQYERIGANIMPQIQVVKR